MNDTHEECRQLITDLVTGDGHQIENLSFTDDYYRKLAVENDEGGYLNISVSVDIWIALLDIARNHTDTYPEGGNE